MYMQKLHTYSIWQAYRFVPREPVQDFPLLLLLNLEAPLSTYLTYPVYLKVYIPRSYIHVTYMGALFSCMC